MAGGGIHNIKSGQKVMQWYIIWGSQRKLQKGSHGDTKPQVVVGAGQREEMVSP